MSNVYTCFRKATKVPKTRTQGEHQGHCQACGRIQVVMSNGMMAKHGYRVAGFSYYVGTCSGSDRKPLEVERSYLDRIVEDLGRYARVQDASAVSLETGETILDNVPALESWGSTKQKQVQGRGGRWHWVTVQVSWADATAAERERGLQAAVSHHRSQADFARAAARDLTALAIRVHGQPLIDRELEASRKAQERTAKKAPIEGAFRTKAAQKDALDGLNRTYEKHRRVVLDRYLAEPGERSYDTPGNRMYQEIPFDLCHFREKHAELILAVYPDMAEHVGDMRLLVSERAKVKAMPVIK
jgi:hypothetical protein